MNMQYEQQSDYTYGYVRIDGDLLTTPAIIYEKADASPQPADRNLKMGAFITAETTHLGEKLDMLL